MATLADAEREEPPVTEAAGKFQPTSTHRHDARRYPTQARRRSMRSMNTALPSQIESLFERHPALCGFCVLGVDDVPDSCPRGAAGDSGLFVGDVGVSPEPSQEQLGEIFQEIAAAVADVLAEEPDATEELRGRTFARALH